MITRLGIKTPDTIKQCMYISRLVVDQVYKEFGKKAVLTSATGGNHRSRSLHFVGQAEDYRTYYFTPRQKLKMLEMVQKRLAVYSKYFQPMLSKNCLHIEYDDRRRWSFYENKDNYQLQIKGKNDTTNKPKIENYPI